MRKFIYALGILAFASLGFTTAANASQVEAEKSLWLDNTEQVLALAKKENKAILINFTGSDWCPPCMMLKREVFQTPEFQAFAKEHLVLQEADFPRGFQLPEALQEQNITLARKYGIEGFPTLIILNSEGNQIGRLGYMRGGSEAFIARLQKIIKK